MGNEAFLEHDLEHELKGADYLRGRFPDAVTVRGQKHLEELAQLVQGGDRAVIFFSVARDDADCFAPADAIDPDYGALLRKVVGLGVEALAYTTRVEPDSLEIARSLPITLGTG